MLGSAREKDGNIVCRSFPALTVGVENVNNGWSVAGRVGSIPGGDAGLPLTRHVTVASNIIIMLIHKYCCFRLILFS